uniref:ORF5 n=1 Tax=Nasonia vitripennis virus TaxID=626355 RepID=C1K2N1_9VIRU|nr:ORF5 [Nasonia vitripennis virus]
MSNTADIIAPPSVDNGVEYGFSHPEGEIDYIDQDDFWVCIDQFDLKPGQKHATPYCPWALSDILNPESESPIVQKMERFSNLEPRVGGDKGPAFGQYRLIAHLPQNIAANIAHISVPGDMGVETVGLRFDILGSLLGIAGSALTSIGGPLITGAIDAVQGIVKDVPIIGGVLNDLGDIAKEVVGGTGNSPTEPVDQPQQPTVTPAGPTSKEVRGRLEGPRYLDYIKMFTDDVTVNDVIGQVVFELVDLIGADKIPCRLLAKVGDMASFTRSVFNRTVFPSSQMSFIVGLSPAEMGYLLEQAAERPNSNSQLVVASLLSSLSNYGGQPILYVNFSETAVKSSYNDLYKNLSSLPTITH